MITRRRASALAPGAALLAFVGLWIGHTLEYARVYGMAASASVATRSVHAYMLPLAALLVVLAAAGALRFWALWTGLGRRIDAIRTLLRNAWRGHAPAIPAQPAAGNAEDLPSFAGGVLALWLPLAFVQVLLYVVQENAEAAVAGVRTPLLGAVSGVHWAAPLVHLGVALLLAVMATALLRLLRHRVTVLAASEALLHAVVRLLHRAVSRQPHVIYAGRPPLQRFGRQLWSRPPPLNASV